MMWLISAALAGDGPWTLAPQELNVYVGSTHYRYDAYDIGGTKNATLGGGGTVASHTVLVVTAGLIPGVEAELRAPWETVRVTDDTVGACGQGGPDFCKPSRGLGDIEGYLKVRALDEFWTAPLSLSISAGVRSGEAYATRRGRLTALGDGQTALGTNVSVGRTASVGQGWYAAQATGGYWYRLGTSQGSPLANEVAGSLTATWSPRGRIGFGPNLYGFHRLGGLDLNDVSFDNPDCFGVLDAAQVQAGGSIAVYGEGGTTVHVSALKTVHARNNPTDTFVVSAGVGRFIQPN